jgi:hypothetical protein
LEYFFTFFVGSESDWAKTAKDKIVAVRRQRNLIIWSIFICGLSGKNRKIDL